VKVTRTTLRLPSKSVQYGYVEVDVEHDGNWEELGQYYYGVVKGFQAGEAAAKNGKSKATVSATIDPVEMTYDPRDPEGPGVTTMEEAEALLKEELGATNITDVLNEDVEEEAPEWENPPPPPSDDDWDF